MKYSLSSSLTFATIALIPSFASLAQAEHQEIATPENSPGEAIVPPRADNSATNLRDRASSEAKNASDQGSSKEDRELAAKIRKEIMRDGRLSTNAQNTKVIVDHGQVTLRGPVESTQERQSIVSAATKFVAPSKVVNQLDVLTN